MSVTDETVVVKMSDYKVYDYNRDHYEMYCMHGKTMLMMYGATGDVKYLKLARLDMMRAKSIKEVGFIRPLGVLLAG